MPKEDCYGAALVASAEGVMARLLSVLRSGTWLTPQRMVIYSLTLIAAYAAVIAVGLLTATGPMDALHRPLGTDFSQVWAAGVSVWAGHPEFPFDPVQHAATQRLLFASDTPFYGWHYPPYFLAVASLVALLPYVPALLLWQGTTFAAYLLVMRRIVPHPLTLLSSDIRNPSGGDTENPSTPATVMPRPGPERVSP